MMLIAVFFLLVFSLIIFGLVTKMKLKTIKILPDTGGLNKNCLREKVSCNTDNDCKQNCTEAQEGEEIICSTLPDIQNLTENQQRLLGMSGVNSPSKFCVPAKAKMSCNVSTGGIPIFTGWGGLDTMEFDCMCSYPLWASSRICDGNSCQGNCILNPGICQPGKFNWDLKVKSEEPTAGLCECDDGYVMVVDSSGLPRCVKEKNANFYSDLDVVTNIQGGQLKIQIDNTPLYNVMNSACSPDSHSTTCGENCCPLTGGICCPGNDFCCPSTYPVCDMTNKRCLKAQNECAGETTCSSGCCNTVNGVCCSDGASCCPSAFPNCDPELPYCNPDPTLLITTPEECPSTEYTQCVHGCCPMPDAICCGNPIDGKQFCCPPEYPVCDTELKMCRKSK